MARPSKFWRIAGAIFVLLNVAGAAYAFARGEQMHAEAHLGALLVAFVAYLLRRGSPLTHAREEPPPVNPRIDYLQQSVDALAIEVERLGEAQRFKDKLAVERKDNPEES